MNTDFEKMYCTLRAYSSDVKNRVSILANASAIIWEYCKDINWAGFYLYHDGKLNLGPFQGKAACTVLHVGKGVCGTAVQENQTIVVPNVRDFAGHVACDSASNSEIVVPIHIGNEIFGVLDIDSPLLNRFDDSDKVGFEKFVTILEKFLSIAVKTEQNPDYRSTYPRGFFNLFGSAENLDFPDNIDDFIPDKVEL